MTQCNKHWSDREVVQRVDPVRLALLQDASACTPPRMATLELEALVRRFPGSDRPALDRLDLTLAEGEVLVLVGPSGCGKSTALRLIAGLDSPQAGRVLLDEVAIDDAPPQDRDIAMVFQGYALYPHMRVRENIEFPLRMRGTGTSSRREQVQKAAERLGIVHLLERYPAELSGGERQRVAIGRALVRRPKVFLFDEPLANLDAALRAELRVELSSMLRTLSATAIYVTHDQVEAMTIGDRLAVMREGRLEQVGTPRAIYEDPASVFVARFIGSPPMNTLTVRRGDDGYEGSGLRFEHWDGPDACVVGFRPEVMSLAGSKGDAELSEDAIQGEGKVQAAEPLGAETVLYLDLEGERVAMRVPGFSRLGAGDAAAFSLPRGALYWFDEATGKRIEPEKPR